MSRAVSTTAAALPAAAPTMPQLPPWVAAHVEAAIEPDPARRQFLASNLPARSLDAASRAIATSAAAVVEGWLEPAGADVVRRWLAPIASSVRCGPESDVMVAAFVAAVVMLQLPARAFTQAAQVEALRRWTFWPSAAEVEALLVPVADRWRAQRRVLLGLADKGRAPDEERPVLGAEERAAIVAKFRADFHEAVTAPAAARVGSVGGVGRPRPSYASDGVLLELYRAQVARGGPGADAAAVRVRHLEERLGREAS